MGDVTVEIRYDTSQTKNEERSDGDRNGSCKDNEAQAEPETSGATASWPDDSLGAGRAGTVAGSGTETFSPRLGNAANGLLPRVAGE